MKKTMHKLRHFFCFFSGEDDFIIRLSDAKTQLRFSLIGVFVSIIFVCCFWSSDLFISNMFHDELLGFSISILVALIFTNLYLLILYTVSPPLLPAKKSLVTKSGKVKFINEHVPLKNRFIGFSLLLRLSLLILIASFIVQPFNVLLFSNAPNHNQYANEVRDVLRNNKLTWITSIIACLIFLLPVYWKYTIRNNGDFYVLKQKIEQDLIRKNYLEFKKVYSKILTKNIKHYHQKSWSSLMPYLSNLEKVNKLKSQEIHNKIEIEFSDEMVEKYEYWADPPFRTKPKENNFNYLSEDDFLKTIYPEPN